MRQILDGIRYDTGTADEIGSYWNGCGSGDFHDYSESLYKTKLGHYFLAGNGGPMSKYAEDVPGGGRTGGGRIIPLSGNAAAHWCETTGQYDLYESEFADHITDA